MKCFWSRYASCVVQNVVLGHARPFSGLAPGKCPITFSGPWASGIHQTIVRRRSYRSSNSAKGVFQDVFTMSHVNLTCPKCQRKLERWRSAGAQKHLDFSDKTNCCIQTFFFSRVYATVLFLCAEKFVEKNHTWLPASWHGPDPGDPLTSVSS